MTDHDQLVFHEPLMRTLGWWPDDIVVNTTKGRIGAACCYSPVEYMGQYIDPKYALAIVTQRTEKELCGRGWKGLKSSVGTVWYQPPDLIKMSLADALRVEIERNAEARSHTPPYK